MTTPHPKRAATAKPAPPDVARAAFDAMRAKFEALAPADLVAVNTDVPAAVSIALGALGHLRPLRPRIVEELPKHPVHYLDELEQIALAAWYAHLRTLPSDESPGAIDRLLTEATPLRRALLVAADALADRKLVSQATVDVIRAGRGDLDTANDLVALAALFHEAWARVQGKTAVTEEEVDHATTLGPQLIAALGVRDNPTPVASDEAALARAQAFSLLVKAYNECRHASRYLHRHDEDPDAMTPSLFTRHSKAHKASKQEPAAPTTPAAPAAPAAPAKT